MDRSIFEMLSREDIEEIVEAYDQACNVLPCSSSSDEIMDRTMQNLEEMVWK
jgi:hypothetical protein